uniref:CCDC81 HU domain-containing protein n=1 Tax=Alexandrium catenella TaxID=2925 RepID=A0A7S1WT69_ALECA
MHSLERVLEDVARQRGPLTKRGAGYADVWDAFSHYLTAVMQQRQTLSVMNFCKIGWRVEELVQGRAKLRPHFQVADSFARAHHLDLRAQVGIPDKHFTAIEEFNFSKAAIRYSQSLTKDNIFMGMRAIVQHLGEVVASGQQMSIDLEVGKLVCSDRDVRFVFLADLYLQEGLAAPDGALESTGYRPSATFAPPSKDALTLSLSGTRHLGNRAGNVKATALGGWDDAASMDQDVAPPMSDSGDSVSTFCPPSASSHFSAHEKVHQEALGRHVAQIGFEAASAMAEREQWEEHLERCAAEDQRDKQWRKALNKEHALHLQAQMRQAAERRAEGRQNCIEQASCHDFPNFVEPQDLAVHDYIRGRRTMLREDLDQQVGTKQLKKAVDKQRERELDTTHAEASQRELALMRQEAAAKRESEKAALTQSWEKDKHIRTVRKAIQDHHKTPGSTSSELSGMVRAVLPTGARQGTMAPGAATPRSSPPGVGMPSLALPSPRADSGPPSSRPVTGSVRRMPLGAAASLALHRERLNSALRA